MSRGRTPDSSDRADGRLAVAFVALVGLSSGTMALQGGASVPMVGLATAGGLAAGGVLAWYLAWTVG
ncbi:hypothetical protein [Natronobacterium gregoryi]|uniref:Uncharacterized protein n=2 Tax=Natronobacterium gregoryi TaxID=44930 RepID=L0AJA9_NATGS|nr:hypothetical protein [Natronobacterium gregoryi]AFZ73257.1 hypothetical protein Natgr_2074 [Natronobacterium gregoryi SP2]ELY71284.1 hypothetical protein C490_05117 [Natronobacterium gregoryi SP2]PLK21664.1 hypothetical protein CYV19_03650 [Natronobacterium gregoryi SP2]SFI57345.1 hypothetical protein SAMN05443661_1027 [Natronobacterium gregoryi]